MASAEDVNSMRFEDMREGFELSFDVRLTTDDIDKFAAATGDVSPLHMDVGFARARGFKDRVVHGGLLIGLVSRMIGVWLPGRNCLFQKCQIGFAAPVYPGMTVRVTGMVDQVSEATQSAVIKIKIDAPEEGTEFARGKVHIGFTDGNTHV